VCGNGSEHDVHVGPIDEQWVESKCCVDEEHEPGNGRVGNSNFAAVGDAGATDTDAIQREVESAAVTDRKERALRHGTQHDERHVHQLEEDNIHTVKMRFLWIKDTNMQSKSIQSSRRLQSKGAYN